MDRRSRLGRGGELAALLGQAPQLLPIHTAITVAIGLAEVAQQPAVGLRFAPVDAAIAIAIGLAEEACCPFTPRLLGRHQIRWGEVAAPAAVQPLEVPFQIGLALHLLTLQPLIAIAIELPEQLLHPLLIALLLGRGLPPGYTGRAQADA